MITITAFKWVPDFAQGQVRDYRARWMLEEVGLPYEVRLIDSEEQRSPGYRKLQPFGQVPVLEEDGRAIFETGAILLHLAERTGKLISADPHERALTLSWLFAALNSVEPFVMQLADVDFFEKDEEVKKRRRPGVVASIEKRLDQVQTALGEREYLVGGSSGEFSIADMIVAGVLRILDRTDILDGFPALKTYRGRCLSRPAFRRAVVAQCRDFEGHGPKDMKWPKAV